jgi:hypothetical protein
MFNLSVEFSLVHEEGGADTMFIIEWSNPLESYGSWMFLEDMQACLVLGLSWKVIPCQF